MNKRKRTQSDVHVSSASEYDVLVLENMTLKQQVAMLEGTLSTPEDLRTSELAQLKAENEALRRRITQLEQTAAEQQVEIKCLSSSVTMLQSENKGLSTIVNRMRQQQLLKVFLVMIQDLNDYHRIESETCEPYRTYMRNFRRARVELSHFINRDDSEEVKEYKCHYILKHRQELKEIETLLNKRAKCSDFTNKIIEYLEKLPQTAPTIDPDDLEEIDNWWNDQIC